MPQTTLVSFAVIVAATAIAPLITDHVKRWIAIPSVVLEILLGILIGPQVLGWAGVDDVMGFVADFGLAMLMFLAGYELKIDEVRGKPIRLASAGWLISLVLGLGFGALVHGWAFASLIIGLALTTTALGTTLPMVRDAGLLPTPLGARVLAVGAAGEFGPIIAVALLFNDQDPARTVLFLLAFGVVAARLLRVAANRRPGRISRLVRTTLGTSAQFAVRLCMVVVVFMLWLAGTLGLDLLLGAFVAGLVVRLFLDAGDPEEGAVVESKIEAIGFGLLIPFFFVVSGMRYDLDALLATPSAIVLLPVFLVLFLVIRGLPVLALHHRDLPVRPRWTLALLASAALPLVVVITTIGTEAGLLPTSTASAMVGAGMLSVLIFPLIALRLVRDEQPGPHPAEPGLR
ncbi:Kef-type K+ transport system, membrane component KefB [Saccharopolyspora kobensis]|uniref:Kef-type K+ transport system, membrane component KefB n=3 Tax=Saccharopolyspora kobensis TaxID=146035 RepID=A0A1H6EJ32_9PSEU|nr:cation:proton antiporter [Saccharopolyspora kobensis]SEG97888.1 Kef-type K+ transport system, membrane component KefB [Saccharopolyspora kobensis]SFF23912.1 transporter, CPA2 family [Saccharopolyspora kobensis]